MPHMEEPQRISRPEFTQPGLLGQGETELFNDGIGQHFTGDPLNFSLCLSRRESPVQSELKIFPLAHTLQTLVAHLLQRALNGLALGVEHAFLERNVDIGCHAKTLYVTTLDLGPPRTLRPPAARPEARNTDDRSEVWFHFLSFASRSASVSSSSLRCRGFWLASNCCSTLCRDSRRLSCSRQRAASSAPIGAGRWDDFSLASACCASTDLLSHPRATERL